ncbi:S41 family peptidase [Thermoanaerobacterium sp. DL9XJH110]|uniref:S41 family peptidase n=1 Tax=Thermoanaerobacterium sp. DL9XJH110 TaxID=3386643 RepID=UPI003BB57D53
MLASRAKSAIKVAVLCMAVSLLSFILGAKIGYKPLYVFNKAEKNATITQDDIENFRRLRPLLDVMKMIENRYVKEVDTAALVQGAVKGMVQSLGDPYSVFMGPDEFQDFLISVKGSFEGVGISLGVDKKTGAIMVVSPIEGTPAQKAGILPKDRIVRVNDTDLRGKSVDEAVKLLRGKKGTRVTVYIERPGFKDLLKFELVRDSIRMKTVKEEMLGQNIGYVRITSFDSYTADEFREALASLKKRGVKGMILDLRNNPGGSLYESVKVADMILGKGLVVYTEDRYNNRLEEYYSDEQRLTIPLVVLVNENSASASEIVAGAIQDFKAGVLVGTRTFGKGSVQELQPLEDGSGLKLTIARYYIPSGRSIDGVGIEPNVKVELDKGENPFAVPRDKDNQLNKAIELIKSWIMAGK